MRRLIAAAMVAAISSSVAAATPRDGAHDFDFNLGKWHTSIERFADPFAKPNAATHLAGTVTVRPVWGGRALLEEIEADGPNGHWEGLTLFLYDPTARQWSQNYANAAQGQFDSAPTIGEKRGEAIDLYSQDVFKGRSILVRGRWADIRPDSHSYEESYSDDGGRSWKRAFFARLTRAGS